MTIRRLADERQRQGMSMTKLAALASIDTKTVSLIERGERSPTLYTILRIAGALELDPESIILSEPHE